MNDIKIFKKPKVETDYMRVLLALVSVLLLSPSFVLGALGEPFNTTNMSTELTFLQNLTSGLLNMASQIMVGLFLLVLALSFATIIMLIGKRSLR